ncbi:MAG: polyamine aminopropyltransferase [Rhodocyclales bacterium]|nr:polyamine aminopropyltransferase [Rhodocyclales bacterium]
MSGQATRLWESLSDWSGYYFEVTECLERGRSRYQEYEVWHSPLFGRMFRLDGCAMTSEADEFIYHENLVHVPGLAHAGLRTALVIGGGDGGSAEELLKYRTMEQVVLVELDEKVIELARKYFSAVHRGAFDDPRLALRVQDGLDYVRRVAPLEGRKFDLVVLDLTDPVGPAAALYQEEFFRACKALLAEGGALSLHVGAPDHHPERVRELLRRLRAVFAHVRPHLHYIPLYGANWALACASDAIDPALLDPAEVEARITGRELGELRYLDGETYRARLVLPRYLREILQP